MINRRDFIRLCSVAAVGAAVLPIIEGCTEKKVEFGDAEFMKLSSILTGFSDSELDKTLAVTYHTSLKNFPPSKKSLQELYKALKIDSDNIPSDEEIENVITKNPEYKKLADTLITYWMSGIYKTKDGMKVSDYEKMYAWKSTGYLIPNAQCRGDFGFWQNKPSVT
ncbi:MAG: sugar dehydrogenase complex small subunit [Ignavibacteria bacterium]